MRKIIVIQDSDNLYGDIVGKLPDFVDVLRGDMRTSAGTLGTRDLTQCAAIAVYPRIGDMGLLVHGYSVSGSDFLAQFDAGKKAKDELYRLGYSGQLMALASFSDFYFKNIVESNLHRSGIILHDFYISSDLRHALFDVKSRTMAIFMQAPRNGD